MHRQSEEVGERVHRDALIRACAAARRLHRGGSVRRSAGFEDQLVAKVGGPTAIACPDGRILVTSHFGQLFVIRAAPSSRPGDRPSAAKVSTTRSGDCWNCGRPGVRLEPHIYLYYTFKVRLLPEAPPACR